VGVRALLGRCLDKDPHTRLRDMGEARVLLSRGAAAAPAARASSGARGARLRAAALAVVALGLGALAGRLVPARPSASPTPVLRQERLTDLAGVEEMPAVSPDGNRLAFVARVNGARQVFLRPIARAVIPQQITSEPADHAFPRWADDNTLIYFVHADEEGESGSIRELLVPGASLPRVLMSADGEADVGRKTGRIATFREDALGTTLVFVESGGVRTEVELRMPGARCGAPRWSADERRVAFEAQLGLSVAQIRVLDVASGEARVVARVAGQTRGLAWLPDDVGLVYSSSAGSTLPYPPTFSLRTVALDGSHDVPLPCEGAGYASYVEPDVTSSGGLVASRVAMQSDIYGYPVGGTPRENMVKARRITRQTGMVQVPSASPDGKQVAYLSDSGGRANVWVANVDGAHSMPITSEEEPRTIIGVPVWSPRGDWITYWKGLPDGTAEQWLVRPNGTDPRRLVQVRGAASWSHDGDWLYYMAPSADAYDVSTYRIPIDGGEAELVRHQASGLLVTSDERTCYFSLSDVQQGVLMRATPVDAELPELFLDLRSRIPLWPHMFALSYDDDWLATPLRDDGTTNLWRFSTADGTPHQVTDFGEQTKMIGRQVSWSKDGAFLFAAVMDIDADIVLLDGALR
jgi:Tol biopolymer transport system component